MKIKNFGFWIVILIFAFLILHLALRRREPPLKVVKIQSRNLTFMVETRAGTVGEVLGEQGFTLPSPLPSREGNSSSFPLPWWERLGEGVIAGMTVEISRPVETIVNDAGVEKSYISSAATVNDLLYEKGIKLSSTDKVSAFISTPSSYSPYQGGEREGVFLTDGMVVKIDRIVTLPVRERTDIPFAITRYDNPFLPYGQEKILTPGKPGQQETEFLITYKNGVEIKRKFVRETILSTPVTETREFGTKIEIEETTEGVASWYAYRGCLCAAHPFYDKGRYARVTNLQNGQSVIVQINDRGPELDKHPDRVIDLDSVAYKALSNLSSGTISVRVELLKN